MKACYEEPLEFLKTKIVDMLLALIKNELDEDGFRRKIHETVHDFVEAVTCIKRLEG
ncbi:MAG: hypothetical protein Q6368_002970 [Candidatus Baldrarchaeota archaeon]